MVSADRFDQVRYDGRPLFYRISLSDMNIPYADPRAPFHRKAAFDLGDAGTGLTANNLKLGCDCLGSIFYLSAVLSSSTGGVIEKPNCVCIHEHVSNPKQFLFRSRSLVC